VDHVVKAAVAMVAVVRVAVALVDVLMVHVVKAAVATVAVAQVDALMVHVKADVQVAHVVKVAENDLLPAQLAFNRTNHARYRGHE